jgi:hypothetical protein
MTVPELIDLNISAFIRDHGYKPTHVFLPPKYKIDEAYTMHKGVKIQQLYDSGEHHVLVARCKNYVSN